MCSDSSRYVVFSGPRGAACIVAATLMGRSSGGITDPPYFWSIGNTAGELPVGAFSRRASGFGSRPRASPRGAEDLFAQTRASRDKFFGALQIANVEGGLLQVFLRCRFSRRLRRDLGIVQVREKSRVRLLTTAAFLQNVKHAVRKYLCFTFCKNTDRRRPPCGRFRDFS